MCCSFTVLLTSAASKCNRSLLISLFCGDDYIKFHIFCTREENHKKTFSGHKCRKQTSKAWPVALETVFLCSSGNLSLGK